jgi:hypothetical protein|tara:strand:- start:213 stop:383 length:171 start_codon:yes stop_codon:yes gene_type:complete
MRHNLYLLSLTSKDGRQWQCYCGAKNKEEVGKKMREYHAFKFKINWMKLQDRPVIA